MEFRAEQIRDFRDLVGTKMCAMFVAGEDVALIFRRDCLFAALNEAFKRYGKELLERGLDRAFNGQTLRIHHLEAALHDQRCEFLGELNRVRVQKSEKHLQNSNLSHFVEEFRACLFEDLEDEEQCLMLKDLVHLRHFLQKVHSHWICLGNLLLKHEHEWFKHLSRLALNF